MDTTPRSTPHVTSAPVSGRALVLGGGGAAGNAWDIGVVAGLSAAGLDVTEADVIIGTSAGSTAAAQLTGTSPAELFAAVVDAASPPPAGRRPASSTPVVNHLERMNAIIASADDAADLRRRLGAAALELDASSDGSWQARWRDTVAARLPSRHWPQQRLLITAIDATTGEPVVFDRHSGIELVDAVAASCSNGFGVPPYRIGGRAYLDGGYRSNADNADLAAGCERVLVLSPFSGRSLQPQHWGMHLATQVEELRARGSRVETMFPAADVEHLFGANAMNLSHRPAAARAGYDQGRARAEELAQFWR